MAVSDDFSTLKEEVETADQRIRASAAQGATELKAMVDEARTKADARAAQINTKAQETADQAEAHWNQVQSDWDRHIKSIRERIDENTVRITSLSQEVEALRLAIPQFPSAPAVPADPSAAVPPGTAPDSAGAPAPAAPVTLAPG